MMTLQQLNALTPFDIGDHEVMPESVRLLIDSHRQALLQIDVLETSIRQESQRYSIAYEYARRQPKAEVFEPGRFAAWYAAASPREGSVVERWDAWISVIHAYRSVPRTAVRDVS